ncbi:prolipoprotein diacylglyceryl transferase [Alphaproteobacteria bacterium]|nr:prolipoprotein diacylglyceryl transferase [Alphaproteobacteria bacterium]
MTFPNIDPVIFEIGPFALRWYSMAYIAGLLLGIRYMALLAVRPSLWQGKPSVSANQINDLLLWLTLGVVVGARIGYVLFYNPSYFLSHPGEIFAVWNGGMSFHGGLSGVILGLVVFAHTQGLSWRVLFDLTACAAPLGILFGRLSNFINGELWGRTTDMPWGMVFPSGGPLPRHPSQLYEAGMEGVFLFILLNVLVWRFNAFSRSGMLGGIFCTIYALSRLAIELVREPDAHLGYVFAGLTMGQLLCMPVLALGIFLIRTAKRNA